MVCGSLHKLFAADLGCGGGDLCTCLPGRPEKASRLLGGEGQRMMAFLVFREVFPASRAVSRF